MMGSTILSSLPRGLLRGTVFILAVTGRRIQIKMEVQTRGMKKKESNPLYGFATEYYEADQARVSGNTGYSNKQSGNSNIKAPAW